MTKRMKLTSIFVAVASFFFALILSLCLYVKPAKAASARVFEVEYGASVKLSDNGLRFIAKMDKEYYDQIVTNDTAGKVELWGYIAPIEQFENGDDYANTLGIKVGGKLDENKIYQKKDDTKYYYANIVITNLDEHNLQNTSFSATVFIKDTTSGSAVYTYAELSKQDGGVSDLNNANRTQYQIVNAAFLDGDKSYESALLNAYGDWFGTEAYPILIETTAQYEAFVSKLENEEFKASVKEKNVQVQINADVSTEIGSYDAVFNDAVANVTPTYVVEYRDGNKLIAQVFVADGGNAAVPADPTKDGYEFVEWVGDRTGVTENRTIYAKWKAAKGTVKDLGDTSVYGVTRADGVAIASDSDVIGQKVVLASGDLGDGAYFPGETNEVPDPTDENNTADQAFLAYDGEYGFNDYFVADFTGKNMPTLAFFANNYDESIFYSDGTKNGVVVATGLTLPNGLLFSQGEENCYCTDVFNGKGLCMWGPHMIYSTAKNNSPKGVLLHSNESNVALGRANLVDGKQYRIIMGMQPGDDPINKAIKLVYRLYDLESGAVVEDKAINTYNFFADGWANAGQTRDQFCVGSIVAYGYFGTTTVLDKTYPIYENTSVNAIAAGLGMLTVDSVTTSGDTITLNAGNIGNGASYTIGQNAGGSITQAYYAINGDYSFDDYIVFDFTGKNMPEVMFFANNYDTSMYYSAGKQGVVVASGITLWDGSIGSAQTNNTKVGVSGPFGAYYEGAAAPRGGNMLSDFPANLARANLDDSTQYRVIMGFTKASSTKFSLKYMLYNLTDDVVVEEVTETSWALFTGSDAAVGNMTLDNLSGSIVLYGKFNTTCTIDKLHGVYENTNITDITTEMAINQKTVVFNNYDGTKLDEMKLSINAVPEYTGETPTRYADGAYTYTFAGWDKELSAVTEDVIYTATYTATKRDVVTMSTSKGVTNSNGQIILDKSGIGDGANYKIGQNNGGYVDQSYLAFDGNYALNDYVAFEFTGKNLPEIAFFAKNYNNSMYAEGINKQGIVVVTGITTHNGGLESGVNGNGTKINYGYPYMIQDAEDGGFVMSAFKDSALGRANLVDGTHYRVIMGFTKGSDHGANGITLHWYLYNIDTGAVVEQSSMMTWNFFTGSNAQVGNMTINDLSGSIVLYGKFGATCTIDKLYGVFEDTSIEAVANGLNGSVTCTVTFQNASGAVMQQEEVPYGATPVYTGETPAKASDLAFSYTFAGWDKAIATVKGDVTYTAVFQAAAKEGTQNNKVETTNYGQGLILGSSDIGDSAHYSGSNNLSNPQVIGTVNQSYFAFDGNYSFNDYVVFDFTGKNMPSIAFFANNYNESMYYQNGDKYGLVVLTGLTTWEGALYTEYNDSKSVYDGKGLLVTGPYMLHNTLNSGKNGVLGYQAISSNSGNASNVALGRANLDDSKQYRVIMGMEAGNNAASVKIVYTLYNITDDKVVEQFSAETYNFFTTGFAKDGQTRDEYCQGSIVLYGHFGTTTTIDRLWGVYENTTMNDVLLKVLPTKGEAGEENKPVSTAPDYSKYTDKFDFYAYSAYSDGTYEIGDETYYIGKSLANLKQYSQYGEAGMTIYFPQSDMLISDDPSTVTNAKKLIDDLAKVGIYKTILQDSRILYLSMRETAIVGNGCQFADEAALDAYIYNCVKDYADYPGVYGIQLGDEPKYSMLSAYAAVYNSIKRVNATYGFNLFVQYNLNPLNVTETVYTNYYPATSGTYEWNNYRYKLGLASRFDATVTRYTQYINDFLNAMNPDSIMYDDYPLMENKNGGYEISDSYIPCLQIVAKAAADRGIKFYNVTQAFENNADGTLHRRAVTEAGAKWLNNILLGFGAKQIAYYTYYTRSESDSTGGESYVDGQSFVDYNGNPTDLYYTMQGIMSDNQIFASTILQFDYKGSRTYGSADHFAEVTVKNSFTVLSSFATNTGAALVTELYDDENGNYMYMAMNALDPSLSTSETLTLTFNGYASALVYKDGVFTEVALNNHVLTATVTPGEAVFVIPYN